MARHRKPASGAIEEVLLTISIDTECDHDPQWRRSDPLSFESIALGLPERLQPLFDECGAIPSYLLTVEVLENNDCIRVLKELPGQFELGTHLHAAFIEPEKQFFGYAGIDSPDFQANCRPELEFQKLRNLTRLFERQLGTSPTSFRAGRFGAGANTLSALQKLGYKVDTSVTPHIRWSEPQGVVDFRQAPEQPYFPGEGTIIRSDQNTALDLLEVPVTMKKQWHRRSPRWFRPWFSSVSQMKDIFSYHLYRYRANPIVSINMMFHSMEVIERASPYPQTRSDVDRLLSDLHEVLNWCRDEGVTFCGLTDCYDRYKSLAPQ